MPFMLSSLVDIMERDMHVGSQTSLELPRYNLKSSPYLEGRERRKKEADHSGLVGGRIDKQGDLPGLSWAVAR